MNQILLKALVDDIQKEKELQEARNWAENLENKYRTAVERAYTLDSADEFTEEGWADRLGDVIASRFLSTFNKTIDKGRSGLSKKAWEPTFMQFLRHQGVRDALQGAREGEIQMPDFDDPKAVLEFWDNIRGPLGMAAPRSRATQNILYGNPEKAKANEAGFNKMMKNLYGE